MTADEYALWVSEFGDRPETMLGMMHVMAGSAEPEETPTPWEMEQQRHA